MGMFDVVREEQEASSAKLLFVSYEVKHDQT